MAEQDEKPRKKNRSFLTLFFVVIFSLLIAMTRSITDDWIAVAFQIVLIFAQIIFVKSLIESYMGTD